MTESRRANVPALTGVRALAALWVVGYHLWIASGHPVFPAGASWRLDPLLRSGWLGVDVFFVLSGFVLQWQVEHERDPAMLPWRSRRAYGRFLGRRVLRVFPAYFACLSILLPLAWSNVGRWTAPDVADVALHLVMTHNAVPEYVSTISGVFWSLPLEWHFYLVFPLGAWLLAGGRAWPLLAIAFVVTWLVHRGVVLVPETDLLLAWMPFRAIEFATGMAAAALARRSRGFAPAGADALFVAGAVVLAVTGYVTGRLDIPWWTNDSRTLTRMVVLSVAIAAMLYAVSVPRASRIGEAVFGNRAAVWIGTISYSLYLWHFSVVEFAVDHALAPRLGDGPTGPLLGLAAVVLPAAFAVAAASYYAVERVFLDRARWAARAGEGESWMRRPLLVLGGWAVAILAVAAIVAFVRR